MVLWAFQIIRKKRLLKWRKRERERERGTEGWCLVWASLFKHLKDCQCQVWDSSGSTHSHTYLLHSPRARLALLTSALQRSYMLEKLLNSFHFILSRGHVTCHSVALAIVVLFWPLWPCAGRVEALYRWRTLWVWCGPSATPKPVFLRAHRCWGPQGYQVDHVDGLQWLEWTDPQTSAVQIQLWSTLAWSSTTPKTPDDLKNIHDFESDPVHTWVSAARSWS